MTSPLKVTTPPKVPFFRIGGCCDASKAMLGVVASSPFEARRKGGTPQPFKNLATICAVSAGD
jgi:hypothetical protein